MDIKNIEELLAPKLGPNKKITNVDISKPPPKGVGSLMLKVIVTVQDENEIEEQIYLVAKKIPSTELAKKIFDIENTFKKEVAFYKEILPVLKNFQKEADVTDVLDNFANFYGARFNLEGNSEVVDDNAVLLLEDLSTKGFDCGNVAVGFDLTLSKKILEDLAKFHGTVIALKQKKPDIFQKEIRPKCTPFEFMTYEPVTKVLHKLRDVIRTLPDCEHLAEKATSFGQKETPKTCREPFGSIIHFDLWVNNILNKIGSDGKIHNIFVDFQVYDYRSPASDVIFFLWTSVQDVVLERSLDHLLYHYHYSLINTLIDFGVDTSLFGYEDFEEELRLAADYEFGHSFVFKFIFFKNFHNSTEGKFTIEFDFINEEYKKSLQFMVTECAKRGWLY